MSSEDSQPTSEQCAHLTDLEDDERSIVMKKYKTVASWYLNRVHEALHRPPTKRRKVCTNWDITMYGVFDCEHCHLSRHRSCLLRAESAMLYYQGLLYAFSVHSQDAGRPTCESTCEVQVTTSVRVHYEDHFYIK